MRSKNTLEYLGLWEMLNNPDFKGVEFDPFLKGNIRDYASINQLICLSNMENLNAVFINDGLPQSERLERLNQIAIQQMEVLPRIKELWKEKLESLHIDTNEVDMDYLATNFNDDFAVYCNFDEKTILSFDFEQPDDEIERLIRRRYLKSDPFLAKFPQKPGGKCKYGEPELELMRVDRATLIEELALNGIEICEDPENYIDRGDYIELVKPAGRIKMIEKIGSRNPLQKKKAYEYARNLNLGGLTGWKLPGIRELLAVYAIKDICGIKKYKSSFYDFWWSASETDGCGYLWSLAFSNGIIKCEYYKYTHNYYARCIRYAE